MSPELQKVLNANEKIIWEGKPNSFVYYTVTFFQSLIGIVIGAGIVFSVAPGITGIGGPVSMVIGILFAIAGPMYRMLVYRFIHYVVTDKRIILQSGLIGRDFEFVDYDKIQNATVDVGILDKVLMQNTGTISIDANRMQTVTDSYTDAQGRRHSSTGVRNVPFLLSHVTDPYSVFNLFKQVSFDVKADINYPNALRPAANAGYATNYTTSGAPVVSPAPQPAVAPAQSVQPPVSPLP